MSIMSRQVYELVEKIEKLLLSEGTLRRKDIVEKLHCSRASAYNALLILLGERRVERRRMLDLETGRPTVVYYARRDQLD